MIEFEVDMGYLLDCDELNKVILNDENGEREPMEFVSKDAATVGAETCTMDGQYGNYRCSNCGQSWQLGCVRPKEQSWTYCPHCRARIIEEATE